MSTKETRKKNLENQITGQSKNCMMTSGCNLVNILRLYHEQIENMKCCGNCKYEDFDIAGQQTCILWEEGTGKRCFRFLNSKDLPDLWKFRG